MPSSLLLLVLFGLFSSTTATVLPSVPQPLPSVEGNRFQLGPIPEFISRIPFPVVPQTWNRLDLESPNIERVLETPEGFDVMVTSTGLLVRSHGPDSWGDLRLEADGRPFHVTLLSALPWDAVEDDRLDGYEIGHYDEVPFRGLATYERPRGFIRLTPDKESVRISDRYTLGDFRCKQPGESRFVVVRPEALVKLELLQETFMEETRLRFERFTIMSAYRTPAYNAAIGNRTTSSRHLYGDGIDVYVDRDGDSDMDDLDGDGRVDVRDAAMLMETAKRIDASPQWGWLKGGAGVYRRNHAHGPFLHIDTRGFIARWGATP